MTDSSGFWSYVHKDDDADGGRIVQLAHDILAQYEMLTNESTKLFLDRDDMAWGNEWRAKIDGSLASVAFFIPVLTPRYFASAVCMAELNAFERRATALGVSQLLLPILYMDVPGIEDEPPPNDAMALVRKFHWADWRELRFADRDSREYRLAVAALASRLVDANRDAERPEATNAAMESPGAGDDEAGTIELMAAMETALPELTSTTQDLTSKIEAIGVTAANIAEDVQGNATFARRLQVLRMFAAGIAEPAKEMSELGEDFTKQLHDVDLGIRAIVARAPEEPESRKEFCEFFRSVRGMVEAAENGLGSLEGLVDSIAPLESLSREVRPPLRDMRTGLTSLIEGRQVMRPWIALMDETGIDCDAEGAA
jgi:hypothetical protein